SEPIGELLPPGFCMGRQSRESVSADPHEDRVFVRSPPRGAQMGKPVVGERLLRAVYRGPLQLKAFPPENTRSAWCRCEDSGLDRVEPYGSNPLVHSCQRRQQSSVLWASC